MTRATVSSMIEDHIETHGIRRFEQGTSSGYDAVKLFLSDRGYDLALIRNAYVVKSPGRIKAQRMHWSKVIELVDRIRVAEGKQTLVRRSS